MIPKNLTEEFLLHSNYIEGEGDDISQPLLAWQYLMRQKELDHTKILRAHKILMLDKPYPEPRGYYRSVPKINVTIGGGLAPHYSMVDDLMNNWLLDYKQLGWKEAHIRFEHIHPFADGNGRIGRMLMNWQRRKAGKSFYIVHYGVEQQEYYKWFV